MNSAVEPAGPSNSHAETPLILIENVHKSVGTVKILNGVSLSVKRGEVASIIGPSGSGKSTLLRCINALTPFDGGRIVACSHDLSSPDLDKRALRRKVGMVFQQYNLFPHRTVLDNVIMAPIHVLGRDREKAIESARLLLKKVGLSGMEARFPGELSGGQQQRVAIARSLAMQPDVMMFDEVTAALDPMTVREVLVAIRELAEDGMTCIIVTHEMNFARGISDTVYFTDGGVIVERGSPSQIFDNPQSEKTRAFLEPLSDQSDYRRKRPAQKD
jgi:polar amino acid transport system ATP-binding protein